jgi:hypothetical protein
MRLGGLIKEALKQLFFTDRNSGRIRYFSSITATQRLSEALLSRGTSKVLIASGVICLQLLLSVS